MGGKEAKKPSLIRATRTGRLADEKEKGQRQKSREGDRLLGMGGRVYILVGGEVGGGGNELRAKNKTI